MALILGICIGAAVVFALSARSVKNYWALPVFLVCPIAMISMMRMMRDDLMARPVLRRKGADRRRMVRERRRICFRTVGRQS